MDSCKKELINDSNSLISSVPKSPEFWFTDNNLAFNLISILEKGELFISSVFIEVFLIQL